MIQTALIGSADGKKFRIFAQSLTLDALLAYANHHLRDLAGLGQTGDESEGDPADHVVRHPGGQRELAEVAAQQSHLGQDLGDDR